MLPQANTCTRLTGCFIPHEVNLSTMTKQDIPKAVLHSRDYINAENNLWSFS